MSSEPSEDAISEFVAITNVTRDKAIAFLKVRMGTCIPGLTTYPADWHLHQANNLDANQAINAYFENPNGPAVSEPSYQVCLYVYISVARHGSD